MKILYRKILHRSK